METFWIVCVAVPAVLAYLSLMAGLLFGGAWLLGCIWCETEESPWKSA